MSLTHAWVGPGEVERLSEMRLRCYGSKPGDRDSMLKRTQNDRFDAGDALILSDATGDVATATSMSLQVNARGRVLPCQGVAWVGTARSHRRRKVEGRGLASHVMHALLAKARERGEAVSMLAPFRVSFYEHFGYGVVERQNYWTLPLSILPPVDEANFADVPQLYVNPNDCIDCGACIPVCPTNSIYTLEDLPAELGNFAELNAAHFN